MFNNSKNFFFIIYFLLSLSVCSLHCKELDPKPMQEIPTLYKGRFRSLDVMARLWLEETYHRQTVKLGHYNAFHVAGPSALSLLWKIQFTGYKNWDDIPLFWVYSSQLKELLGLSLKENYFSYQQLFQALEKLSTTTQDLLKQNPRLHEEFLNLSQAADQFSHLKGPYASDEKDYEGIVKKLIKRKIPPIQIEEFLKQDFPLNHRLSHAGPIFKVLPGRNSEWYSLNALTIKVYNTKKNSLEPISNFIIYSDDQFEKIRDTYFKLIDDYEDIENKNELAHLLLHNYDLLIHMPIQKAWEKSLVYPSKEKLRIEYWYYQFPWVETTIVLYATSIIFLLIGKSLFTQIGSFFTLIAFALNTLILTIRCFILQRPPVSNMFETVIYVPWIAVLTSLFLFTYLKNSFTLLASSLVALILLALLKVTGLGGNLENVQAVLDSQFWLIIHVLMVVGSYGVFALAGILGHIYLFQYLIHKHESIGMQELGKTILQTLYIGVALLIPGTILGGIWAAQSWGRFWDWDPKESWAFISSCIYLIFIHAYTFRQIHFMGLAVGSILGLLAISFTWYGVNYILGTGLHSYGFGSGGEFYYYLFIGLELLFLSFVGLFILTKVNNSLKKQK